MAHLAGSASWRKRVRRHATQRRGSLRRAQPVEFAAAGVGDAPVRGRAGDVSLEFADREDLDEAALTEIAERAANGIRRLTEMCRNLLVRERTLLFKQLQNRPLHRKQPNYGGACASSMVPIAVATQTRETPGQYERTP